MTEKLKQITVEELAKLPKETQAAINTVDWVAITEEIGERYVLDENELTNFQVETLLILIGFEDPTMYAVHIEDQVGLAKDEAKTISQEVFKRIFMPINTILLDNVKKSEKAKNPHWQNNLDFILSGGDYSNFLTDNSDTLNGLQKTNSSSNTLDKREDMKIKLVI